MRIWISSLIWETCIIDFPLIPHTNLTPRLGENESAEEHSAVVIIIMFQEQFSRAVALKVHLRFLER